VKKAFTKNQKLDGCEFDTWGLWATRIKRKKEQFAELFWNHYARFQCIYWQVEMGKGCRFFGKISLNRSQGSIITVGNDCRFRSAIWSNMVGINRPCLLCTLEASAQVKLGKGCGFSGTVISAAESIEIGAGTICGGNVTITDTDWHPVDPMTRRSGRGRSAPIKLGCNVWVGLNAIILKGVTIGDNSIISAGSVVTSDIPSDVIASGHPAKVIKSLQQ